MVRTSPAAPVCLLVVGGGVLAAGRSYGVPEFAVPAAVVLFLAAYGMFTRWLQRTDRSRSPVLRGLEWLRRAIAYDPPPRPDGTR